ncbi:type II toxin-antitoxin system CcdA family antitoxin [Streptomyces sp. NPDC020096]
MATTSRVTITLPSEQVEALKKLTDNVSGHVTEAVARQIRSELLKEETDRYQSEHGAFTEEELAQARTEIFSDGPAQETDRRTAA